MVKGPTVFYSSSLFYICTPYSFLIVQIDPTLFLFYSTNPKHVGDLYFLLSFPLFFMDTYVYLIYIFIRTLWIWRMKVKDGSKNFVFERRGNIDTYNTKGVKIKNRSFRKKEVRVLLTLWTNWFSDGTRCIQETGWWILSRWILTYFCCLSFLCLVFFLPIVKYEHRVVLL